jgi:Ca2+-binding EF-hand superfamily protein
MEFLFAVSLTTSKDPEQKIELFFKMYDIDRNGLIDENEMHDFVEVMSYERIKLLRFPFHFFLVDL